MVDKRTTCRPYGHAALMAQDGRENQAQQSHRLQLTTNEWNVVASPSAPAPFSSEAPFLRSLFRETTHRLKDFCSKCTAATQLDKTKPAYHTD